MQYLARITTKDNRDLKSALFDSFDQAFDVLLGTMKELSSLPYKEAVIENWNKDIVLSFRTLS